MTKDEYVLCIPRALCPSFDIDFMPGLSLSEWHGSAIWTPREAAEVDESLVQLVTYCVLRVGNGDLFAYQRRGSEGRLTGRTSIGVGGHVSCFGPATEDDPRHVENHISGALHRELHEEIGTAGEWSDTLQLGLVQSKAKAVDRMHLGIVYVVDMIFLIPDRLSGELAQGKITKPCREYENGETWTNAIAPWIASHLGQLFP